mmetsp:Transcript_18124/g.28505  ORF Transcript_18124/g.28505 Transcript_18124/m.28505 type:complete len:203 (-) Transcript_18124:1298-1906(-)
MVTFLEKATNTSCLEDCLLLFQSLRPENGLFGGVPKLLLGFMQRAALIMHHPDSLLNASHCLLPFICVSFLACLHIALAESRYIIHGLFARASRQVKSDELSASGIALAMMFQVVYLDTHFFLLLIGIFLVFAIARYVRQLLLWAACLPPWTSNDRRTNILVASTPIVPKFWCAQARRIHVFLSIIRKYVKESDMALLVLIE